MDEYANNDHWEWVQALDKTNLVSELGKTVANILGYVGCGIYNCPISHKRIDWTDEYCIVVNWSASLANWDFDNLTRLVLECHERLIRINIKGISPGRMQFLFHQRISRNGGIATRMPTIETMIERRKKAFEKEPTNDTDNRK